jgi:hypothetical protein
MKAKILGILGIVATLFGCETNEVAINEISGTYTITSFQRNNKDTLFLVDSLPIAIGDNELVLATNLYKGTINGRIQSSLPLAGQPIGTFFQGEYYLSERKYELDGVNNKVTPSSMIVSLRTAQVVRTTVPASDTLSLDTIRLSDASRYIFMGEWAITESPNTLGCDLIMQKRGPDADSVNTYKIVLNKLKD